ncbi:MAG: hypothetical protein K1X85_12870 [Ignavibacteria bacterium]|nr:hypothetical protein [Ignavibacteria bacterium]
MPFVVSFQLAGIRTANFLILSVSGVPAKFTIGQNYPNPFKPVRIIAYRIPLAKR